MYLKLRIENPFFIDFRIANPEELDPKYPECAVSISGMCSKYIRNV